MFIRFSTLLPIAALVAVVTAVPNALEARGSSSSCNTGANNCCNQVLPASDPTVTTLAQGLGISLAGINVPIGVTCTPISVIGVGSGASCTQQSVCCTGNSYSGVLVIGCSPVNVAA